MTYSRVVLASLKAGQPFQLPQELFGLADESLVDLSAALAPVPEQFDGVGFWPVDILPVEFDSRQKVMTDEFTMALDEDAKRVSATPILRDLTAEEIAALPPLPEPKPKSLGRLGFIRHVQATGGMTDQMLVDARNAPAFAALWIKLDMADGVERDDPLTGQALGALAQAGFLPKGAAAVLGVWPTL